MALSFVLVGKNNYAMTEVLLWRVTVEMVAFSN
jgi:hypothetical protein